MYPDAVLPAILATQKLLLERQAKSAALRAKLHPDQSMLSANPHAQPLAQAEAEVNALPFWQIEGEAAFDDFMGNLSDQLALLDLPTAEFGNLPLGYGITRFVLSFEFACNFDSWLALENAGRAEMEIIRECYRSVGMHQEAQALALAEKAWYDAGGHEGMGYEAAGEAYSSVENMFSDEGERWFSLLEVLRNDEMWAE